MAFGKKKKKRRGQFYDKHHIIPKSRGGTNDPDNILIVSREKHEAFHKLFQNRLPDEIISYLNEFWFKGKLKLEWWK